VAVNVPVTVPAAIVIEAGTVAAALSEDSVTTAPPAGAGELSVIVAVEVAPEETEVGFSARFETEAVGGLTVSVAVF
jgi:hypothetical protein